MAKYVNIDRDTELLRSPNLRDWVPTDHLVHFVMDAVDLIDVNEAAVNERGTGSAQYPPRLLLGLLVYSYATGVFSSRQIERSSYENVAVRLLCADTHPDHDTLCTFRRKNGPLLQRAFAQVLELAAGCGVLKIGAVTVAIDGTKVLANASKHSAVSYGHAEKTLQTLDVEIAQLLAKAEQADAVPLQDGLTITGEVTRRQERQARLRQAKAEMEARAYARFQAEQAEHEAALSKREAQRAAGKPPAWPRAPSTRSEAEGKRSSKLHRRRKPHHENQGRLPTSLQRASRRRDRFTPDRGPTRQSIPQRQTRTGGRSGGRATPRKPRHRVSGQRLRQ